jgi:serine/threonine protein kinase
MQIAGTVETFDADAFKMKLVSTLGGISAARVTVTVQAASVKVTVQIRSASADSQAAVMTSLNEKLADIVSASAALGIPIESMDPPRVEEPTSFPSWAVGLLVAGFTIVSAIVGYVACRPRRAKGQHLSMAPHTAPVPLPAPVRPPEPLPAPARLPEPWKNMAAESEEQWEWPSTKVKWGTRLGNGTFGTVFVVESNGLRLAAKRIELLGDEREKAVKLARREALAIRKLSHPHVVNLIGVVLDDPSFIALLMELADCGSLRDLLDTQPLLLANQPPAQARVALQIAEGMAYLHSREPPLMHHDLKSANVLVFSEPGTLSGAAQLDHESVMRVSCKLCDFGLATGLNTNSSALQSTQREGEGGAGGAHGGTWAYMAPEAFDDDFTAASEVYAFAIVLWEVLTGKLPWSINPHTGTPFTQAALVRTVCKGERLPLPSEPDERPIQMMLRSLVERCWHADARSRPSFAQVAVQLRLALRQSLQTNQGNAGSPPSLSVAWEADTGDRDAGEASSAEQQKLMYTLRHGVHRSHRMDGYNEAHKSFGPTARVRRATSGKETAGTSTGTAQSACTTSTRLCSPHLGAVHQALLLDSVQSALGTLPRGDEQSLVSAHATELPESAAPRDAVEPLAKEPPHDEVSTSDPTLGSFAVDLQSAAQHAIHDARRTSGAPRPPRLASANKTNTSAIVAYV